MLVALVLVGACSNNQTPSCSGPPSGSTSVTLSYSQSVPAAIYCDGATGDAESCGNGPLPFDGATWNVTIDGSSATVTSSDGGASPWSCAAVAPESAPNDGPDGAPGTGCYLLVTCGRESAGDGGPVDVQLQLFAQSSSDVIAIVHDDSGDCCTDEYTGTWQ